MNLQERFQDSTHLLECRSRVVMGLAGLFSQAKIINQNYNQFSTCHCELLYLTSLHLKLILLENGQTNPYAGNFKSSSDSQNMNYPHCLIILDKGCPLSFGHVD